MPEIFAVGTWTSPTLSVPTGGWSSLEWQQTNPGGGAIFVDVLDTNSSILVQDLSGSPQTISIYPSIVNSNIKLRYRLYALEQTPTVDNVVLFGAQQELTNTGKNQVVKWLANATATQPLFIAVGTGSTTFSPTMTSMMAEIARFTINSRTLTTSKFLRLESTLPNSTLGGQVITEMGLWNTSSLSSGQMYAYRTFSAYTMSDTFQKKLRWDVKYSNVVPMMDAGINHIRDWMGNATVTSPTHVAWSSDNSTVSSTTFSAMPSELTRTTLFITQAVNNVYTADSTLGATIQTGNILRQAGLFNSSSAGTLFVYQEFPQISKGSFVVQGEFVVRVI